MTFGEGPLRSPLLVEAVESLFVPICIYNNVAGKDERARERFEEPSWNNPVVRFVDGAGKDLIPRKDGVWTEAGIAARTSEALRTHSDDAPPAWFDLYLQGVEEHDTERVVFEMSCFWEGEARLGGLDGVTHARAAWLNGKEVVDVRFRPERLSFERLLAAATELDCARAVHTTTDAQLALARAAVGDEARPLGTGLRRAGPKDERHHLSRSHLRFLPMTELQALRLNSILAAGGDRATVLSPRQIGLASELEKALARDPDLSAALTVQYGLGSMRPRWSALRDALDAATNRTPR